MGTIVNVVYQFSAAAKCYKFRLHRINDCAVRNASAVAGRRDAEVHAGNALDVVAACIKCEARPDKLGVSESASWPSRLRNSPRYPCLDFIESTLETLSASM